MHQHREALVRPARTAAGKQGALFRQRLGLHEQLGEGRVSRIGGRVVDDGFEIGGHLDPARCVAEIAQVYPTQFDACLGHHGHARFNAPRAFDEVGGLCVEDMAVFRARLIWHGLAADGPEGAVVQVAKVDEKAQVVLDHVAPPAVELEFATLRFARPGRGEHEPVGIAGQGVSAGHDGNLDSFGKRQGSGLLKRSGGRFIIPKHIHPVCRPIPVQSLRYSTGRARANSNLKKPHNGD